MSHLCLYQNICTFCQRVLMLNNNEIELHLLFLSTQQMTCSVQNLNAAKKKEPSRVKMAATNSLR